MWGACSLIYVVCGKYYLGGDDGDGEGGGSSREVSPLSC